MPMKNPPHPGGLVLRQCIEPLGLSITDAAALRSDAHHIIGTGEREARDLSRNGRATFQGFRRQRRELACATGVVRSRERTHRPAEAQAAGISLGGFEGAGLAGWLAERQLRTSVDSSTMADLQNLVFMSARFSKDDAIVSAP